MIAELRFKPDFPPRTDDQHCNIVITTSDGKFSVMLRSPIDAIVGQVGVKLAQVDYGYVDHTQLWTFAHQILDLIGAQ